VVEIKFTDNYITDVLIAEKTCLIAESVLKILINTYASIYICMPVSIVHRGVYA